jgi:hypothetical protein
MTGPKWHQFLEHIQIGWANVPVQTPQDVMRLFREFGVSQRRAERELQEMIEEFDRRLRCATEIERPAAA